MKASELLDFYEKLGPDVFKGNRFLRKLRQVGIAKYDRHPLQNAIDTTFGDKKRDDSKARLVIPSLNLENGEVYIFEDVTRSRPTTRL